MDALGGVSTTDAGTGRELDSVAYQGCGEATLQHSGAHFGILPVPIGSRSPHSSFIVLTESPGIRRQVQRYFFPLCTFRTPRLQ